MSLCPRLGQLLWRLQSRSSPRVHPQRPRSYSSAAYSYTSFWGGDGWYGGRNFRLQALVKAVEACGGAGFGSLLDAVRRTNETGYRGLTARVCGVGVWMRTLMSSRRVCAILRQLPLGGHQHFGGLLEVHAIVHRLIRSTRVTKGLVRASHLEDSRRYRRRVQRCMHASESQTGDRIQTGIRTRDLAGLIKEPAMNTLPH